MDPVARIHLKQKIGQMILAGFRGFEIRDTDPIAVDLSQRHLGGVLLYDQEMADASIQGRNIRSPEQVWRLVSSLKKYSPEPLWVAIDQEGGRVNRLRPEYGFPPTLSHEELGAQDPSHTYAHARKMAQTISEMGINLNLAPVVDVDANPDNPIIKGKRRSFSSNPLTVAGHAARFILAHHECGVRTCLKHFPGHGSARADTHLGLADVSEFWTESELIPFRELIDSGLCDMVMSAHVFNAKLDPQFPSTLSKSVMNGLLRRKLGWDGVIISDDLEMKAITDHFGLETAVERAIVAGVDLLCFGNNIRFDPNVVARVIEIIERLVESGRIPETRINESHQRIMRLKNAAFE